MSANSSTPVSSAASTPLSAAAAALPSLRAELSELYTLKETFFPADVSVKQARLSELCAALTARVASIDTTGVPSSIRSALCFVTGRALDALETPSPEAEAALSRAVRLDASSSEAWAALGHVQWKRADLDGAVESFESSIARAPTASAHRSLASLARARLRSPSDRARVGNDELLSAHANAITHAKAAIALDLADAQSWDALGLAYLCTAIEVSLDVEDLRRARTAFLRGAALAAAAGSEKHPDTSYNRGVMHSCLEEWDAAEAAFTAAVGRDPTLPGLVRPHASALRPADPTR